MVSRRGAAILEPMTQNWLVMTITPTPAGFLAKDPTDDHVIAPGSLTGPNDNGNNMPQMFAQGQVATYQTGDWNTLTIKQSVTFPVGVAMLPLPGTGARLRLGPK